MDFLRRDLDKADLINMIHGTGCRHEAIELMPSIKKFFNYTGGFVDEFRPSQYMGEDESLMDLNLIYGLLKELNDSHRTTG